MLIPVGYAQINLKFTGAGAPNGAQVTFGIQNEEEGTPSEVLAGVRAALDTSNFMGNLASSVTISSILVKLGPNETGGMLELPEDMPGEVSSQASPPQVTFLARKTTLTGGRKAQGRMFIPGVPENAVDASGIVAPAFVGDLQTAMDSFLNSLMVQHVPMFLLHSDEAGGMEPIPVARLAIQSKVATQRRRLRG